MPSAITASSVSATDVKDNMNDDTQLSRCQGEGVCELQKSTSCKKKKKKEEDRKLAMVLYLTVSVGG